MLLGTAPRFNHGRSRVLDIRVKQSIPETTELERFMPFEQ
jgi:hypothetical protein